MSDAEVRRPVVTWLWGGALLTVSAVTPLLGGGFGGTLGWIARLLAAAALIVFAVGIGGGSVVARRPVGVIALFVLALAPPILDGVTVALARTTDGGTPENLWLTQVLGYGSLAVAGAAALVAAVETARARVLPDPWRWAPAWGLAIAAGMFAIGQVALVTVGSQGIMAAVGLLEVTGAIGNVLVPLALGILAMVLGARGLTTVPAQVYPPV